MTPACPTCGAPTRERKSNRPGVARWFPCTMYPKCKGAVREFAADLERLEGEYAKAKAAAPIVREARKAFAPSKYQAAIFDFIRTGKGHGVVEAVAGSGKTTTLVEALELAKGRVIFTAFNAAIAAELAKRAPGHVTVSTLHSLGLRATRKAFPQSTVDKDGAKVDGVCEAALPVKEGPQGDQNFGARRALKKLISLAKATLVKVSDTAAIVAMAEQYGVDCDTQEELTLAISELPACMAELAYNTSWIDFDDMIWFPYVHNLAVEKYDWVFIDETQDLNRAQVELALKACAAQGRIIAVGDRYQSIYGFRGADCEAMPRMIERLGATVLPLSITYRCPTSHVEQVLNEGLVPALEARPNAPMGTIRETMIDKALEEMTTGDLVMCRTNAPLVSVAFALLRAGKKAIIRGRDLGTGLVSLIRKLAARKFSTPTTEVLAALTVYADKERAKLVKAKKSTIALDDKIETLQVLSEGCDDAACMVAKIEAIFSDTDAGVVCSSVHRAKGFEANRTFIVKPELMPHPMAKKEWEQKQEANIRYVCLTRSKSEMVFVHVPDKK
jgi:DNA helicase II / ATP-dependent DNA helicase PcrA